MLFPIETNSLKTMRGAFFPEANEEIIYSKGTIISKSISRKDIGLVTALNYAYHGKLIPYAPYLTIRI